MTTLARIIESNFQTDPWKWDELYFQLVLGNGNDGLQKQNTKPPLMSFKKYKSYRLMKIDLDSTANYTIQNMAANIIQQKYKHYQKMISDTEKKL